MKRIILTLMTLLFLGSTSLVFAEAPAASTSAPTVKSAMKHRKHVKKIRKGKKAPAAAPAVAEPAAK